MHTIFDANSKGTNREIMQGAGELSSAVCCVRRERCDVSVVVSVGGNQSR